MSTVNNKKVTATTDAAKVTPAVTGEEINNPTPMDVDVVATSETNHAATIKELKLLQNKLLDELNNIELDSTNDERETNIIAKFDKVTKRIKMLESVAEKEKPKGSNDSKYTVKEESKAGGISITMDDIPKFQLKYQRSTFFAGQPIYATVEHFVSQFELILNSAGKRVNVEWKCLIPLSFPPELESNLQLDNYVRNIDYLKYVILEFVDEII
ncbi:unnamed protein product [Mucor hiemalis]